MKKLGLPALLLVTALTTSPARAQVTVLLHVPPPGQLNVERLWWVDLDNRTRETYRDVWLHGEVHEATRGPVYRANSNKFDLPPGRMTLRYRDIQVRDQWHAPGYEVFVLRSGQLPAGEYEFYVWLEPDLGGDTVRFTVEDPTRPRLVSPRRGDSLQLEPVFSWTRPRNWTGPITYELRLVEVLPGQSEEEALRANRPWFLKRGLRTTMLRYPVAARKLDLGRRYAWQVKAEFGRGVQPKVSEQWGFSKLKIGPMIPVLGPLSVERTVTRVSNWFQVKLTIKNIGSAALGHIVVTDSHRYFQCLDDAWKSMLPPPGGWQPGQMMVMPGPADNTVRSSSGGFRNTITIDLGGYVLGPNRSLTVRYSVLPLLTFSLQGPAHTIGEGLRIAYESGGDQHVRTFNHKAVNPVPGLVDAWQAADYMILACPSRVAGTQSAADDLLVRTGELARQREGALCYLTGSSTTAPVVRNVINAFGTMLKSGWQNGYLLIVGEDDVIPTWSKPAGTNPDIPAIDLSDFDYADPDDDLVPERRVGRLLGRNATELRQSLQHSLDYRAEGIGWQTNSPVAVFVSGPEPGKWLFVKDMHEGRSNMSSRWGNNTVELHTDFITTRYRVIRHALYALSQSGGVGWGSAADTLGNYSYKQLACWLLSLQTVPGGGTKLDQLYPPKSGDDQFPDANGVWRRLATNFGETGYAAAKSFAEETMLAARNGVWYGTYLYYSPESSADPPAQIFQNFDWATVAKDVIVWVGHSWANVWGDVFAGWEVQNLHIATHPVVIAFGCHCGDYDDINAVAREMLRQYVAVYVGASESMYPFGDHMLADEWWSAWTPGMSIGEGLQRLKTWNIQAAPGNPNNSSLGLPWMTYFVRVMNLYGCPKVGGVQ